MKKLLITFLVIISTILISKTIHISSDYIEPTDNKITYSGNIILKIEEDNLRLFSEDMVIKKINEKWIDLSIENSVKIEFKNGIIQGENMSYNIETQKGTIKNASLTVFDSKSTETILINCEELEFDLKNNIFNGNGNNEKVLITKGSIIAKSFKFSYNRAEGKLILEKYVELEDKKRNLSLLGDNVIINTENNNMKGKNVKVKILVE